MKKIINSFLLNPFFTGSFVMIVGSNLVNVLNYVYHFIIGRLLGPANYGELSALFSLIGMLGIIPTSFGLVIVKTISSAKSKEETKGLISWFSKRILYLSLSMFLIVTIFSKSIASFLNIQNYFLIIILGVMFLFSLSAFLNRSVLQGLLKFKETVASILAENTIKLFLGIILIFLGFSVAGAIVGVFCATIVGWWITKSALKDYKGIEKEISPDQKKIFKFALPVLFYSFASASLISTDLLLVKHFFSSYEAGVYAAVSTLGKIIFFGTAPISSVMFPLVSKKNSTGGDSQKVFLYSLILTVLISVIVVLIYILLPTLSVFVLYGSRYVEAINYLGIYSIFIALYTTASLLVNYFLSLNKTKIVIVPLIAAFLQAGGIWFYHQNLTEVIMVSIIVGLLLVLTLTLYYLLFYKTFKKI